MQRASCICTAMVTVSAHKLSERELLREQCYPGLEVASVFR